jgi:hypothetical protein
MEQLIHTQYYGGEGSSSLQFLSLGVISASNAINLLIEKKSSTESFRHHLVVIIITVFLSLDSRFKRIQLLRSNRYLIELKQVKQVLKYLTFEIKSE